MNNHHLFSHINTLINCAPRDEENYVRLSYDVLSPKKKKYLVSLYLDYLIKNRVEVASPSESHFFKDFVTSSICVEFEAYEDKKQQMLESAHEELMSFYVDRYSTDLNILISEAVIHKNHELKVIERKGFGDTSTYVNDRYTYSGIDMSAYGSWPK